MNPQERASNLFQLLSKQTVSEEDVQRELRELEPFCDTVYQQEKLASARNWAEIYFSPRRWERWGSQERVRGFLLQDVSNLGRTFKES